MGDPDRARFEAWWADEKARNSGVPIGADYRHWALKGWQEAVRQEREACAELCDELDTLRSPRHTGYMGTASAGDAAAAIRARSEQ